MKIMLDSVGEEKVVEEEEEEEEPESERPFVKVSSEEDLLSADAAGAKHCVLRGPILITKPIKLQNIIAIHRNDSDGYFHFNATSGAPVSGQSGEVTGAPNSPVTKGVPNLHFDGRFMENYSTGSPWFKDYEKGRWALERGDEYVVPSVTGKFNNSERELWYWEQPAADDHISAQYEAAYNSLRVSNGPPLASAMRMGTILLPEDHLPIKRTAIFSKETTIRGHGVTRSQFVPATSGFDGWDEEHLPFRNQSTRNLQTYFDPAGFDSGAVSLGATDQQLMIGGTNRKPIQWMLQAVTLDNPPNAAYFGNNFLTSLKSFGVRHDFFPHYKSGTKTFKEDWGGIMIGASVGSEFADLRVGGERSPSGKPDMAVGIAVMNICDNVSFRNIITTGAVTPLYMEGCFAQTWTNLKTSGGKYSHVLINSRGINIEGSNFEIYTKGNFWNYSSDIHYDGVSSGKVRVGGDGSTIAGEAYNAFNIEFTNCHFTTGGIIKIADQWIFQVPQRALFYNLHSLTTHASLSGAEEVLPPSADLTSPQAPAISVRFKGAINAFSPRKPDGPTPRINESGGVKMKAGNANSALNWTGRDGDFKNRVMLETRYVYP